MKTWSFGIIGCGIIADFHIAAIKEIPNARLAAVSSRNEQKAKDVADREGCEWTADYRQLLARPDIDVVCVTTSSGSHGRIGVDVLRSGKHLLVEKPMALQLSEAVAMMELAKAQNLQLAVVSQRRFEQPYRMLKQLIEEGHLGKLLLLEANTPVFRTQDYYDSADWRGTIAEDGGALMNQGIHQIDLMLWYGGKVKSVMGKTVTQTHRMEAEDLGVGIVHFASGAIGTVMASTSIQPGFPPGVNVYGEKGTVKLEGSKIAVWHVPGIPEPEFQMDGNTGGASDPRSIGHHNHKLQFLDLIDALEQNTNPLVTGEDGYRALQLVLSLYESSRSDKIIIL